MPLFPLAVLTNDAAVFGLLLITLALIFYTSSLKQGFWFKFYRVVPSLLLCYFIPSLYNSFGLIDGEASGIYPVVRDFLLPASLVLLTLSVDIPSLKRIGGKAVIMFLAASFGVMIGGPIALGIAKMISPETVAGTGGDAPWRGFTAIAGSWIGGSANQAAMKEIFGISDRMFSAMIAIDVIVGYLWFGILIYGVGMQEKLNRWLKADSKHLDDLKNKMEAFRANSEQIPSLTHLILIVGLGFGVTGAAHLIADWVAPTIERVAPQLKTISLTSKFFWVILVTTFAGLAFSFTPARKLEFAGASKIGTLLLYVLIASLGMKMNLFALMDNPALLLVGALWIIIHIVIVLIVARLIKASYFFVAVGSMANIGGPASAPVIAAAFHPVLAPVGVLLAVLGFAIGTWAAYLCGILMQWVAG